jgi:glyoxylase-like metal-dependent hydrolase (beta-lactamase superfamily II)
MIDPHKLESSARRLYGDMFNVLWGKVEPVPAGNVELVGDHVLGLECFPTVGHAVHHVCYMDSDGVLYAGDALGVRFFRAGEVIPVTPPPDIDLESWHQSLDAIEARVPNALALPHFGIVDEPEAHLQDFRRRLMLWAEIVRRGASAREFAAEVSREIDPDSATLVELTEILRHSFLGLKRYWAAAGG